MTTEIEMKKPCAEDGLAVHDLVKKCPPLDENSIYCNLLQASHFADSSVSSFLNQSLVGFVSGYRVPQRMNTLFVWQVAVSEEVRGVGLAKRMIMSLLSRDINQDVEYIETTITPDNKASWALFESLSNILMTNISSSVMFEKHQHFQDRHETELLVRIGPFKAV